MIDITSVDIVDGKSLKVHCKSGSGTKFMVIKTSYHDFINGIWRYNEGLLMQDAFPTLNADEREFLISGTLPDEFNEMFGSQE